MRVGVLALQGAADPHIKIFESLGCSCTRIRDPQELNSVDRLLLPGGESTTMLKLLDKTGLAAAIINFAKTKPIWGICAGAILIAQEVVNPKQSSLGLINIKAHRNHYGSQLDSFKTKLVVKGLDPAIEVDFIRAPLLEALDSNVEILAQHNKQAVMLRQGQVLASSFHSELGTDARLHKFFLEI